MPRETLSRGEIVTAAVELLDAEGLEGLNMRALGKRLGSAPTAMYWHVGSKANLIIFAADRVWNEIALPDAGMDWRTAASVMASELYAMLSRHPWLVQAFGSYVLYGAGKAQYDDRSLDIFEQAGFAGGDADRAAATVFTFVLGNALGPAAASSLTRRLSQHDGDPEELLAEQMASAREIASQFPRLQARLDTAAAAEYAAAPQDAFQCGLQAVLDGLELSRTRSSGTAQRDTSRRVARTQRVG